MNNKYDFTEGKIIPKLVSFSFPVLLAVFLQAMYGAADLFIVGRFGDKTSVSAVSTGSQMMQSITEIVIGLTMGTTVLLAQKIGEKRPQEAARTVGSSVCIFSVLGVIISIALAFTARPFAALLNAPEAAFEKTVQYVTICACGAIFIVGYNVISGIFRGIGNSELPLLFVGVACVFNILGDLLLVGVFGLDAAGTAIATVAAQALSVALSVIIIIKRGMPFPFGIRHIRFFREETLHILRLGSPLALQNSLTGISFLVITSILNSIGLVASAAVGVAEKTVVFIMLIPMSFMSSVSAFVAQNEGAGKPERSRRALFSAMGISLAFGVCMFAFTFFKGDLLAGLFTDDREVIASCAQYLRSYAIDCILVCVLFCSMGYFNGRGKTIFVMAQGILAAFFVRIPYSYFMSRRPGATMFEIGLASPFATALSIILCAVYFALLMRSDRRRAAKLLADKDLVNR